MKEFHYYLGRLSSSIHQHLWLMLGILSLSFMLLWTHPTQAMDGLNGRIAATLSLASGENVRRIDEQLADPGTIAGMVTGPDSSPAGNMPVAAYRNDSGSWEEVSSTNTTSGGTYQISSLPPGTYRVRFGEQYDARLTYAFEFYDNATDVKSAQDVTVASGQTAAGIDAQLDLPSVIEGTVTDSAGNRLREIDVRLYREEACCAGAWSQVASKYTDVDGKYRFNIRQLGTYRIGFFDPSEGTYVSTFYQNATTLESAADIIVGPGETKGGIDGEMQKFGSIAGTVTELDGSPIEGFEVTAYAFFEDQGNGGLWNRSTSAYTDSSGKYLINRIIADTYRIGFTDYISKSYQNEFYNDLLTVEAAEDIVVDEGESIADIDAQLALYGSIAGIVIGPDGLPVENLQVSIYAFFEEPGFDSLWGQLSSVDTNENGEYLIEGLPTGVYRIGFQDANGVYLNEFYMDASSADTANDVVVGPGQSVTGINAQLTAYGSISGTISNPEGSPIPDIQVAVYAFFEDPEFGSFWGLVQSVATDENGGYLVEGLAIGIYRIGFQDASRVYQNKFYMDAATVETATDIAVGDGESVSGINTQLISFGSISGTLTAPDERPIPDMNVVAYALFNEPCCGTFLNQHADTTTNENGEYRIDGLIAGTYRIGFLDEDNIYQNEFYADAFSVEKAEDIVVGDGESVGGINAELGLPGQIVGTVTDSTGTPIEQVAVQLYILAGDAPESVSSWQRYGNGDENTDESGRYTLPYLFPGTYRVGFVTLEEQRLINEFNEDAPDLISATDIQVAAGQTITIDAKLKRITGISGQVTDTAGGNLSDIFVGVYRRNAISNNRLETWEIVNSSMTGNDGTYEMLKLAPGSYRVYFNSGESLYHDEFYSNVYYMGDAQDILVEEEGIVGNIDAKLEEPSLNVKPKAQQDQLPLKEGTSSSLLDGAAASVLENDDDAEGAALTATLVDLPKNGTLTFNPDGTFSYAHDGSETTEDHFTYMASDGVHMSDLVTVTIDITLVNDAPKAVADTLAVDKGGTATSLASGSSVLANDSDEEGATLTAILIDPPAHGTLTLNDDGTFTYVHDGGENLGDTFTYRASDGTVESDTVIVSIQIGAQGALNPQLDQHLYLPLIN